MQPSQSRIQRGHAALWTVTTWAAGGSVPDATIRLAAAPESLTPVFSFGCGSHDGSASCDLGALDANSAQRQLQAKVTVPASATAVTSVRLTAVDSAAGLSRDPQASAATTVTAAAASPSPSAGSAGSTSVGPPVTDIAPLPVGNLPYLPSASPSLSPGGNAAALFPSVSPSGNPAQAKAGTKKTNTQAVANSSTPPLGAPVVGAQLAGLGVLALAFVLAVAKLSIRRRTGAAQPRSGPDGGPPNPVTSPAPNEGTAGPQKPTGPPDDAPGP